MSAVSGLNPKAEKGRSKYVALDINSLYKGKSLENPKATIQPKHGLQSLGKVGTGRRMPPPANLPSLKSENSGNNPNISLVPSGGQGWGSTTKEKGKTEETNGNQQQSPQSQPASSLSQTTQKTSTTSTVATSGVNKTWSSVTSNQEDGGQERNFLGQQSPFFPQEFPKLAGGDAPTEGNQKSNVDTQYGPGPSLRPQTEGSWGRGTLQQQPPAGSAGGQQQSSGSGVNGSQVTSETQPLSSQTHMRDQRQYSTSRGGPITSGSIGSVTSGSTPSGPPMGPVPPLGHGPGMGGQMGPGSALHPPPQFRGMMPSFMFGRNTYSSGYPSNYTNVPPPPQQNARPPYPYSENSRRPQPVRPLAEEEAYQRPAAIITEKALKGFDEILQNDTQDTWATSHGEIDYNAKLVFSDDEESPVNQKKEKSRETDEKSTKATSNVKGEKDRDRKPERERSLSDRERESRPSRESDWSRESRSDKKNEQENDWSVERGDGFDRDRHGSYPPPRPARPGPRSSSVADDDELWRQRRKQHTEEMTITVERARQRRAEEEKHYEQSKQSAQEKAKSFEKSDKEKESVDIDEPDRSRHSSESREDKPPSRDGRERERDRDRSQPNYQGYNFSRQFQKNVPPRFQKQAAEYMRQQQTQQPIPLVSPQSGQSHFMRSQSVGQSSGSSSGSLSVSAGNSGHGAPPPAPVPMGVNYDAGWGSHPSYVNQVSGMPAPVSKSVSRQRSNSQESGTDSYESDSCAPESSAVYDREARENYWNRDRRQNTSGYENWHSPSSNDGYYDQKLESNKIYDQRHEFKRSGSDKDEKPFDAYSREPEYREKEFDLQDYRYKGRDSFKESHKQNESRDNKDKMSKSNSWANTREYEERMSDPFEEPHESCRDKPVKEKIDRYERTEKERWDKERPPRPDSRDSRASRDSGKDERHTTERHETNSQPERKGTNLRDDKKEKAVTLDWGDSPYPVEPKRREWHHHHPPPITPKQFESIGPPKKNLTPLRRSNATSSQNIPEKKSETIKDDGSNKKADADSSAKKDKEAKEEKNEKIKSESVSKESEKHSEKFDQPHFEKLTKSYIKESVKKVENDNISDVTKKESIVSVEEQDKSKDKHEHSSRNEANKDRRRDGRDRAVNSRSRGGSASVSNNQPGGNNNSGRYESNRGRGGSGGRSSAYGNPAVPSSGSVSGSNTYRGKREYRRSRVERGPRFDRQKERDKDKLKIDKKEKNSDDTSCSEVDDGKLGHLRQKDEDSEVSVDEASASTTESAQAEKYQGSEIAQEEEKTFINDQPNSVKDINVKNEKYKKEKKDSSRIETKAYDEKPKDDKGGFAPRGEPSRRGRGGGTLSFRNSRGGSRHGPSSYGPPPSRAGFGGNKQEKLEEQKIVEENFNENSQSDFKPSMSTIENINSVFPKDSNKSRSLERPQQRRPGRFDHLPPRFQKRNERRFDKFDQSYRGRGRGGRSGSYQGSGNQMNKIGQTGKENLSDVANEEWETASESSDVAERRDRRDDKDEPRKKDSKDKTSSASRKSFSSQRPVNESSQGRRANNESRRGGGPNSSDRNRQRDNFPRETRTRDSGRGRQNNYGNGSDRRVITNNTNSHPSSSAGHPGSVGGRNSGRSGNPSSKAGPFQPKSEGTAVYRVDEIKLQDPNGVQAALTDLTNRRNMKAEVAVSKVSKSEKDKSSGLEGYDLNNYASVVIIDDHPEVGDDSNLLCGADDGFQEVTSKKRHKVMIENEVKKMKKEPHARNKSGSRSRQRLPPRFAKQRENLVKSASAAQGITWDVNMDMSSKTSTNNTKDASPAPPPSVNAWEKPINHSLRSQSPIVTSITPVSSSASTITSSGTSVVSSDVQILASTSKSSSFDRSDQHDSGIDVSDQPASAASSQRSSPSNDCKILTPTGSGKSNPGEVSDLVTETDTCKPMCTVVFENKNFKAENAVLDKFGGQTKSQSVKDITAANSENMASVGSNLSKSKEASPDPDEKSRISVPFPAKESFAKTEEGTEMKLDFNFQSGLEQLTDEKASRNSNSNSHLPNKTMNIGRSMEVSAGAPVGVQSPISPSADDLNLKIQSVKKVWENDPPLPTVMEHPQTASEENTCPTSYGSFSSGSDPSASVYNTSVDTSSQTRKDAVESAEISFRESSPLQQSCANSGLPKNIDHNVSSVKSHIQLAQHNAMAGPHCAGPLSPPLMGGLETMTGIRTIAGLASSVQVAGIPAIPSPPTVLFNSSQPMPQTGMYQPLQMDSRQTPAAAVAAAMVQFSQSPHGYAPLGTYGLSHQPPPNPQLSNAYGQQSLFVQPPATHQGQDIYSSNQYRVQPPYPQSQHISSNQVLGAQQNIASSHLLGSQLVQTRPTAGPSPAAPHLQNLHGLQAVQPAPQTSYFSTSAQPQTANYYHQPPATPGSPMQQQPQYPSHQSYGSQSALNVLPQTATVTPNFRNFGSHQYKAPNSVMNNIVPEAASLRSTTRSPTIDVATNRNMFGVSTAGSTTMNTTPVAAVPPMSSSAVGKIGQPQGNALPTNRINSATGKTSQYSLPQSQQPYYPFGQQKFSHVQSSTVRAPQVLFPNVVRNSHHQQLPAVAAAASNLHYPPPIQRPGPAVAQAASQPPPKIAIRPQGSVLVPGGKLTSAQQAKLRAEAVQQTHMFFAQSKTGKHEENVPSILSQEKSNMQGSSVQKLSIANTGSEEEKEKQCVSSTSDTPVSNEGKDTNDGGDLPAGEE